MGHSVPVGGEEPIPSDYNDLNSGGDQLLGVAEKMGMEAPVAAAAATTTWVRVAKNREKRKESDQRDIEMTP